MDLKKVTLRFPKTYVNHRYSLIHFSFFIQYAKISGIRVELVEPSDTVFLGEDELLFSCEVDGKQIIVDYADHHYRDWKQLYKDIPYFKFQTTDDKTKDVISLGPPIVGSKIKGSKGATMREYMRAKAAFEYSPGSMVLSKQIPNGAATKRRKRVHSMLEEAFGENVDIKVNCDQIDFWKMHETAIASVCVPGATNNMADRGQTELLGMGVCTISPEIKTIFPYNKKIRDNYHYIQCNDDYSDLVEIVQTLYDNPKRSIRIGKNAKRFYEKYYSPEVYWKWIVKSVMNHV